MKYMVYSQEATTLACDVLIDIWLKEVAFPMYLGMRPLSFPAEQRQ